MWYIVAFIQFIVMIGFFIGAISTADAGKFAMGIFSMITCAIAILFANIQKYK